MRSESVQSAPRYLTLRDYVRVVRKHWMVVTSCALVATVAVYAFYAPQKKIYQAQTIVAFQDQNAGLEVLGQVSTTSSTATNLAAAAAASINGTSILDPVKQRLRTNLSEVKLSSQVQATAATGSSLLYITAQGASAGFATQLADAVANQVVSQSNTTTRSQLAIAAHGLKDRVKKLTATAGLIGSALYLDQLNRLEAASVFAKSATIQQPAQLPTAPISPKPARNAIFGFVLGIILGILMAFGIDSLDRRIRTGDEIESHLEVPLVGQVRDESLGRVTRFAAQNNGRASADLEGFRILWRNIEFLDVDTPLRTIAVTSALPEEGKSTVSASLASVAAAAGKRVLLIETDLRRPTLAARLECEPRPGLAEHLSGRASRQDILQRYLLRPDHPDNGNGPATPGANGYSRELSFEFIAAGEPTSRAPELLGSRAFVDFLAAAREYYDVVLLDTSPILPVADTLELIPLVDGLIMCVRAHHTTTSQVLAAKATLARFPPRPTGAVVTGITKGDERDYYAYAYSYAQT